MTTNLTALPAGTQKRQTCSVCLRTTTDYTTEVIDRRTSHEVKAGRPERLGRFHTCRVCASRNLPQPSARVTYEISVYVATFWATGSPRGTAVRTFSIEEAATILGGCRAIDKAVEQCRGAAMVDVHSPEISPNPAVLGWPVGS